MNIIYRYYLTLMSLTKIDSRQEELKNFPYNFYDAQYSIQTSFLLDITHSFSLRKSNSKSICPLLDSLLTCQTIFCSQNSGGCMCLCGGTMYVVVKLQLVIVVQNIWWNILYLYTIYINSKNIFPYEFGKWYSYTSILLWKLICSLFFH